MRRSLVLAAALFVLAAGFIFAQFRPEELAMRSEWEVFLKTADIVRSEDVGEGITKPKRFYLKKGDREARAVWKNVSGEPKGYPESWEHEIVAYRLDKLLGVNMVPPTVERTFRARSGSLQLWVDLAINEHEHENEYERNSDGIALDRNACGSVLFREHRPDRDIIRPVDGFRGLSFRARRA